MLLYTELLQVPVMISNPNEAPASESKTVLKESFTKMNSANVPPNDKNDGVPKIQSEARAMVEVKNSKQDHEIKKEEATATDGANTSLNEDSNTDMTDVSENDLSKTVRVFKDADPKQDVNETKENEEAEALQADAPNMANELNISMIEEDDDDDDKDAIINEKNCHDEEEYDKVLHNLDDFDLYKLDYESDHEQEGGLETLQSPLPKSAPSSEASWPNAAGGEILKPGDHVYMWCTLYQHHGIVLSSEPTADPPHLLIAEFTNLALAQANTLVLSSSAASGATVGTGATGAFRFVKETETTKWHKMKYNANPFECVTWRPGTCSAAKPSKARKILLRVQFLHDCRHLLPEYHLLSSNCETVAVWCVTGKWETLQYHHTMKWSQGASVGLLPVAPGIAGLAAGLAFWHSNQTKGRWKDTEETLNENFEWYSLGRTPKWSFEESPP